MGIAIATLSGFLLAVIAPWVDRLARRTAGWLLALLPTGLMIYFFSVFVSLAPGRAIAISYPWAGSLGVPLSFYVDGLSLLFALLISGIGALVIVYSGSYLAGQPQLGRFYALLLMFMASMLGLVLAGNVITLFVFWELTSLASYLLIGFEHEHVAARAAALQALLVTGGGGLALLAGLVLLGQAGGSMELATLLANGGQVVQQHPLYLPILLLILAGAFTKSAQFPFHFWLPNAMEAPTPVSAYLHSATMVKAGIYLLARLSPVLGDTEAWHYLVTGAGTATMLLAAVLALAQTDLKRILAYSTVSTLGALTLLLGLDTTLAVKAAMLFVLVHALYKGALFLVAGAVDHGAGTRDVRRLGGLARAMPITTAAAGLAALSMAGLPPTLGFINKELLYEAKVQAPRCAGLIATAGVTANVLLVAIAGVVGFRPFWSGRPNVSSRRTAGNCSPAEGRWTPPTVSIAGKEAEGARVSLQKPHEAPLAMWLGPIVLAGLGLLGGLFPEAIPSALVSAAGEAVRGRPTSIELSLWHGMNPILALSILTVTLGAAVYGGHAVLGRKALEVSPRLVTLGHHAGCWGAQTAYEFALRGLYGIATTQTRLLQSGYLRFYLLIIVATTVSLGGYTLAMRTELLWPPLIFADLRLYEVLVGLLILAATGLAITSSSRLTVVAALGVVGYGVALVYTLFGAPDLAMTQFAIETLTVFLFVLVLYRLPRFASLSGRPARVRDIVVALSAGGLMTLLVLITTAVPRQSRLAPFYAANAVPLARSRNIDNVILVDFRALDTLGEITVLAVAAIGVYALLKLRLGD